MVWGRHDASSVSGLGCLIIRRVKPTATATPTRTRPSEAVSFNETIAMAEPDDSRDGAERTEIDGPAALFQDEEAPVLDAERRDLGGDHTDVAWVRCQARRFWSAAVSPSGRRARERQLDGHPYVTGTEHYRHRCDD